MLTPQIVGLIKISGPVAQMLIAIIKPALVIFVNRLVVSTAIYA